MFDVSDQWSSKGNMLVVMLRPVGDGLIGMSIIFEKTFDDIELILQKGTLTSENQWSDTLYVFVRFFVGIRTKG